MYLSRVVRQGAPKATNALCERSSFTTLLIYIYVNSCNTGVNMQGKADQMRMKMDWTMYAINSMKNVFQEDRDFSRRKKILLFKLRQREHPKLIFYKC